MVALYRADCRELLIAAALSRAHISRIDALLVQGAAAAGYLVSKTCPL